MHSTRRPPKNAKLSVWELYKTQKNKATCLLKTAKITYYSSLNTANPKIFWSAVRSLNQSTNTIPKLSHNGSSTTNDKEKAETLNSFFFCSALIDQLPHSTQLPVSITLTCLNLSPFSPSEIEEMLLLLVQMTCCSIVLLTILRMWVSCNKISTPSQTGSQLTT